MHQKIKISKNIDWKNKRLSCKKGDYGDTPASVFVFLMYVHHICVTTSISCIFAAVQCLLCVTHLPSFLKLTAALWLQLILSEKKALLEGTENQYGKAWKTRSVNAIEEVEIP